MQRWNQGGPFDGVNLQLQSHAIGQVLGNLNVIAVGIQAVLTLAADRHGAKAVVIGFGPVVGFVGALHTDLQGAGSNGGRFTGNRKVIDGTAVCDDYDLFHQCRLLVLGDFSQNCIHGFAQRGTVLEADGNANVRCGCGKAGIVVLKRNVR